MKPNKLGTSLWSGYLKGQSIKIYSLLKSVKVVSIVHSFVTTNLWVYKI